MNEKIGYNYEKAINVAKKLNDIGESLVIGIDNFCAHDYADKIILSKAWYSPESEKFENEFLIPYDYQLCGTLEELFNNAINIILDAAKFWCNNTGNQYHEPANIYLGGTKYEHPPYGGWKGPEVYIDINIVDIIKGMKQSLINLLEETRKSISMIKNEYAFLGDEQQQNLNFNLEQAYSIAEEKTYEFFDKLIEEIQKCVEKYKSTAKRVSTMFSGGVTGVTSSSNSNQVNRIS